MKTGMKAWVDQRKRDISKKGKNRAPWIVFWNEPGGGGRREKSCGPGKEGWRLAQKEMVRIHQELVTGTYQNRTSRLTRWSSFRNEYQEFVQAGNKSASTIRQITNALNHFERICRPGSMAAISTRMIDSYVAKRQKARGKKRNSTVTPASINKELRHLKAALRLAHEWDYLPKLPKIRKLNEPKKLVTYVPPEHFTAIYKACEQATKPTGLPYSPSEWWRALLVFAYMTGWRVSEPLAVPRSDVDFSAGTVITRHGDNKSKQAQRVPLHPLVIDHLTRLRSFDDELFPWPHHRRTLWSEFLKIQQAAQIHLPCLEEGKHECTPSCHVYGFHDLRRGFATLNAGKLTADMLQSLMRHKDYQTTQKYINMARQLDSAVENLFVPEVSV